MSNLVTTNKKKQNKIQEDKNTEALARKYEGKGHPTTGRGGPRASWCVRLTNYHPRSAERQENPGP